AGSRRSSRASARPTRSRCIPAPATTSTAPARPGRTTPPPRPTPGSARSRSCAKTAADVSVADDPGRAGGERDLAHLFQQVGADGDAALQARGGDAALGVAGDLHGLR